MVFWGPTPAESGPAVAAAEQSPVVQRSWLWSGGHCTWKTVQGGTSISRWLVPSTTAETMGPRSPKWFSLRESEFVLFTKQII